MDAQRLPLFPLGRPLFPGHRLKLQVFERRYIRLVRECMTGGGQMGVVGIYSGSEASAQVEFCNYGCSARISNWDSLTSGLLGIEITADQPFRVLASECEEDGLWVANVQWLTDSAKLRVGGDFSGLVELAGVLAKHRGAELPTGGDAADLSWLLAGLLPISAQDAAALLAEQNPVERLEWLSDFVDKLASR